MANKLDDEAQDKLYGKAEEALGQTAVALSKQGRLAYEWRKSNDAMRVLSFVWGRNARNLARAVVRWPAYFDATADGSYEPDEYQVLFMLAALPLGKAKELEGKWRQYSWRAWRVREAVEEWRGEQKDPRILKLRAKGKVEEVDGTAATYTLVTLLIPKGRNDPKPAWQGRKVAISLTESKGE